MTTGNYFEVARILEHRRDSSGNYQYLIRWRGFDQNEDSWEPHENLSCPSILNEYTSEHNLQIKKKDKNMKKKIKRKTRNQRKKLKARKKASTTELKAEKAHQQDNGMDIQDTNEIIAQAASVDHSMPHDSIDNQGAHKKSEASSSRKRKLNYQSSYGLQLSCIEAYDGTVIKICYQFRKLGNALTIKGISQLVELLNNAASNSKCKVVVFYTMGPIFSPGIDYPSLCKNPNGLSQKYAKSIKLLIDCLINHPKILVAQVQGPAMGLAFVMLAYFDFVYASSEANFSAPYTKLGQPSEGCSSKLFPQIFGIQNAKRILLKGEVLTVAEAKKLGLVTQITCPTELSNSVQYEVEDFVPLDAKLLKDTKSILSFNKEELLKLNEEECETLAKYWVSEQFKSTVSIVKLKYYLSPESFRFQYKNSLQVMNER